MWPKLCSNAHRSRSSLTFPKVGSNVQNLREGDYVGVPWLNSACGKCEYCQSGWETLCPEQKNTGFSVPGCCRQFTTIAADFAVRIPPELSPEQAARKPRNPNALPSMLQDCFKRADLREGDCPALLCAGVTVYKALKESEADPGESVCIIGAAGGLGHLAVQYSKAMGFRTLAVDVGQEKVDYVRRLGAEQCFDACLGNADVADKIVQQTSGGVRAAIVIANNPSAYALAVDICRPKGVIVCVSMPRHSEVSINMVKVVLHRLTLRGSIVGTRQDMIEALEYARSGAVKTYVETDRMENINQDITKLLQSQVMGRTVLTW